MARREYGGTLEAFTATPAGIIRGGLDVYCWDSRSGGTRLGDLQAVTGSTIADPDGLHVVTDTTGAIDVLGPEGYAEDGIWISADANPTSPRLWLRALDIAGSGGTGSGQLPARLSQENLDATYARRPGGGTDGQAIVKSGDTTAWATISAGAATSLPLMTIDVDGGAAITSKEVYSNANLRITGDGLTGFAARTQIRGRGNYTWGLDKKPYRLKLTTAATPLGLPLERDFALLANHTDASLLNTALAMTLGAQAPGLTWTPKFALVDLVLNGAYVGVYQLIETVEISSTAPRVPGPAAKGTTGDAMTGTYLLEIDPQYGMAEPGFTTPKSVRVIYDDPDGTTAAHATYISGAVNAFENALYSATFKDPTSGYLAHINRDSFIDWYLIQELASNQDSPFNSSCKLFRTADAAGVAGKLHMGPLWDFDISFGNVVNAAHPAEGLYTRPGARWLHRMFADAAFVAALQVRWAAMVTRLNDPATGYAASLDRLNRSVATSRAENHARWGIPTRWDSNVAAKKAWIARRIEWLTAEYNASADGSRGDTSAATPATMTNTTAPSITGTATTGQTLTVAEGSWAPTPDSYGYQWRRDGQAITGATAKTYVLVSGDEGKSVACAVTAIRNGYAAATATSPAVTPGASGAAATTPADIAGLAGWWKADTGVTSSGGKVAAWADQSGLGRHATQGTVEGQPLIGSATQAGKPLLTFTGSHVLDVTTTFITNTAFTVLALVRRDTSTANRTVINLGPDGEGRQCRINATKLNLTKSLVASVVDGDATLAADTAYVASWRYDGTTASLTLNGVADGAAAYAGTFLSGEAHIGARAAGAPEGHRGDIGELVVFNKDLTSAELTAMTRYLGNRWSVSVA